MLQLRLEGERLAALDQFEELLSVDVAKVDRMDHQEAAARKVLTAMQGRGVLADEVGLGKTIEAGLIVKELRLRGLVDRVLILCPATLREQWRAELAEKFDEEFDVAYSRLRHQPPASDRLILSLNLGDPQLREAEPQARGTSSSSMKPIGSPAKGPPRPALPSAP